MTWGILRQILDYTIRKQKRKVVKCEYPNDPKSVGTQDIQPANFDNSRDKINPMIRPKDDQIETRRCAQHKEPRRNA
jgi:hypothetical protein